MMASNTAFYMHTIQTIVDAAELLANNTATDSNVSTVVDTEVTAELLYKHAVMFVIREMMKRGENLENLARDVSIELGVDSSGDLPDEVLREYAKRSYIPADKFSSYLDFPDYQRYRYDNQLCYFAVRNGKIYYSCELGLLEEGDLTNIIATVISESVNTTGINWIGLGTFRPVAGRRVKFFDDNDIACIDAFVDFADDDSTLVFFGRPVTAYTTAGHYKVYDQDLYVENRALTSVQTTVDSETVTCAGGAFTAADIGRRLQIKNIGGTVILDAMIAAVSSATTVTLTAQALATGTTGTASVQHTTLILNIPSAPELPASAATPVDLSDRVAQDVIVAIAAVLKGEVALAQLIELSKPKR
jgi:hypothetical protein